VSSAVARVLEHLVDVGFQTRDEPIAPFGELLALVGAVAWDATTSQLALISDLDSTQDVESWRQLLFAGSGIRHQLAGDGPAAFGTPVILAIVDEEGERRLRELAEDLAENYALFSRVEVNLIRHSDLQDDARLDVALAPLLPCCRRALGQEISRGEVQRFWEALRQEIHAAGPLDGMFASHREKAARDSATALIGDSAEAPELPAPAPLAHIEIENFRSFTHATIDLAGATVIHGANGSGKSSIIESLELAWAGRSQRQPDDVQASEYARHLPRDGSGEFAITTTASQDSITTVADAPRAELPRCVLAQESIASLVSSSPQDRYLQLLATTGLEIPDLKQRTGELVDAAKRDADAALTAAGLPRLARRDSDARKHLIAELGGSFAARLPSNGELVALERTLTDAAGDKFTPREWEDHRATAALTRADTLIASVLDDPDLDLSEALDDAQEVLRRLAAERQVAAHAAGRLLDALRIPVAPQLAATEAPSAKNAPRTPPLPAALAVRWLSHSRSVADAAAQFRTDAEGLAQKRWSNQLTAYADALQAAADAVPQAALEPLTHTARVSTPVRSTPERRVAGELYADAGFTAAPDTPQTILPALGELAGELQRHAGILHTLASELAKHPARRFAEHSQRVLAAVCHFELARSLRREGPVMRASETLVGELLQDRLAPVLRELVAATVRFEWYFKPLQVPESTRSLVLGGLSTPRADLDARMTLNSAERHILGVAWFLALHLLQPPERRRVPVLDDPTSGFDTVNQAGFIATLRAFARLTRPEQLIIATQDDTLAAVLAEELASVDDWPHTATRIRCRRDANDMSTTSVLDLLPAQRSTAEETDMLGLEGKTTSLLI
jgi:AAA domain